MKRIVVTLQVDGVHRWLKCPLPEVSYLKSYHRHMFHIKCWLEVRHSNRDVEIIMFKHKLREHLREQYFDMENQTHFFGDMSCEMIAEELYTEFGLDACEVLEDGENGALYDGIDMGGF